MFDRRKYKDFALKQLKGRWGVAILISFVTTLIMLLFDLPDYLSTINSEGFNELISRDYENVYEAFTAATTFASPKSSTLLSLIEVIVDGILTLAALNVFLRMSRSPEPVSFSKFIEGLNDWWKGTLAALWRFLWVSLWTLLFVIPGLIKMIEYSQMFYILGEYNKVSVTKAMRISMVITRGHKSDLFITYLSFLGWIILSALTCGVGFIFLKPYMEMTLINAYHALMKEALETGKLTAEDLE